MNDRQIVDLQSRRHLARARGVLRVDDVDVRALLPGEDRLGRNGDHAALHRASER